VNPAQHQGFNFMKVSVFADRLRFFFPNTGDLDRSKAAVKTAVRPQESRRKSRRKSCESRRKATHSLDKRHASQEAVKPK